jgi:uncharacterized protein (TIGR02996 family)
MHPEHFFDAILDRPQDDAPRYRYADWLDERCDPLGEFIRVQCRLATLPAAHACVLELERRERELLAEHEKSWVDGMEGTLDWWTFRRGFMDEIGTCTDRFLDNAGVLFERAPIREVHLCRARDRLGALAASAYLQRADYLDLSGNALRDHGARLLASSPHLVHVHGLNLSSNGIGDGGLKALLASRHLPKLRDVYLDDNRISDGGARALANAPLARQLDALHLRFNAISPSGAELLRGRLGSRVHLD